MMSEECTDLDVFKNSIVQQLFIKTADQTYVVARWCFLNGLHLDFYWNALHAIEKYLKAALLLNGHSSKKNIENENFGHDICRLYTSVYSFAEEFFPREMAKPAKLEGIRWTDELTEDFVDRLNGLGDPNNRYNLYGFTKRPEDIHKLDQLAFAVRNVAQKLESYAFMGKRGLNGPSDISNAELLRRSPNRPAGLTGSKLAALTGNKATAEAKNAALQHNLSFAPANFDHGKLFMGWSADNPVLYRRIIQPAEQAASSQDSLIAELADWVMQNIHLPKGNRQEIKAASEILRNRSSA